MRAALGLFTALPLIWDGREQERAWIAAPLVGLLTGVVWFMVHQLAIRGVGALSAGVVVVAVGSVLTGMRGLRGLYGLASATASEHRARAAPPAEGMGAVAVVLVILLEVTLLQRVNLAPAAIAIVPLVSRTVQTLLLREGDDHVGLSAPTTAIRVWCGVLAVALLTAPIPLAALVHPRRLNGPVEGLEYIPLGLVALAAGLVAGLITRAWVLARFGPLDPRGWHTIGLIAQTAALAAVAVPIA